MLANKNKVRRNKFFRVFFMAVAVFAVISALATTIYVLVAKNNLLSKVLQNPVLKNEDAKTSAKDKAFTVVALFGVDQVGAYRTDVNMLVFFNHKNQEINVVSVPRDTKFNWPEELYTEISAKRRDIPKIIPINEVPAYVNADVRNEASVKVLENAFHMNIDYYVNLDLTAFKYIVDVVGPIPFEVPEDMNYSDPAQNLHIQLSKGLQELNGAEAEQLVRYRGYPDADLGRIKTQQAFLKAFIEQVLKPENKVNLPGIIKGIYPYIQTNFKDAADYLVYLDQISLDKVQMTTLPGSATEDKKYAYDSAKSKELFETILTTKNLTQDSEKPGEAPQPDPNEKPDNQAQPVPDPAPENDPNTGVQVKEVYDVKLMPMGVYNGTDISGLAAKTKETLEKAGYRVVKTGNYPTKPVEKTILKVYAEAIGEELLPYFTGAEIQVDESLKGKEEEIVIVLGLTEKR